MDANLIEGEPYNRLARKNKRRRKCGATKFKYLGNVGNQFQKPAKTNSVSVGPGPVDDFFASLAYLSPKQEKIGRQSLVSLSLVFCKGPPGVITNPPTPEPNIRQMQLSSSFLADSVEKVGQRVGGDI